jgi:hypothetical protein
MKSVESIKPIKTVHGRVINIFVNGLIVVSLNNKPIYIRIVKLVYLVYEVKPLHRIHLMDKISVKTIFIVIVHSCILYT